MKQLLLILFIFVSLVTHGQTERSTIRQGNKQFKKGKFTDAEVSYRKSLDKNSKSSVASYNLGDALYKQGKYEEAANVFANLREADIKPNMKSKVYHNLGNSLLQAKKFPESVQAYKNSLKLNPKDKETKYNLSYAQRMMQQQQKQQQQQNNQNNKDKKDQKNQQKQQQQQNKQDQQQQQQQQQQGLSKEDAKRMLEAAQNDENQTQDKVKKEIAVGKKTRPVVDW
jgi:pentatricopeptide repeat protein